MRYDEKKFILDPETAAKSSCFTIEPAGKSGSNKEIVQWYLKNYFTNEDLGFSYMPLLPNLGSAGKPIIQETSVSRKERFFHKESQPPGRRWICVQRPALKIVLSHDDF